MDIYLQQNSLGLLQEVSIDLKPINSEIETLKKFIRPKDFDDFEDFKNLLEKIEKNGNKKFIKEEEILDLKKRQLNLFTKETDYAKETT